MKDTLHRDLNSLNGLTESSEGPGWPDWKVTAIPEKGNISDYLKKAEQNLWLPRNLWGEGGTSYLYTTKTVLFSCTNAPALLTCSMTQKWSDAPCGRPPAATTQRPPPQGQEEEKLKKERQELGLLPPPRSVDFCYVIANCGLWSLNNMTCTSSIKGC